MPYQDQGRPRSGRRATPRHPNLIPFTLKQGEEWQVSDGLGILRSFLLPESAYASMIGSRFNEERDQWEFER